MLTPDRNVAADRQAMSDARLPMQYRDSCAHLLIPLNTCRVSEYYLPWKCEVRLPPHSQKQRTVSERKRNVYGSEALQRSSGMFGTLREDDVDDRMEADYDDRTRDIVMRSASMRSSRREWRRWTRYGKRRVVLGVIRFCEVRKQVGGSWKARIRDGGGGHTEAHCITWLWLRTWWLLSQDSRANHRSVSRLVDEVMTLACLPVDKKRQTKEKQMTNFQRLLALILLIATSYMNAKSMLPVRS
jgi:NADH dehydrogenase (ubiquinone) 1 beta subcomplex subunit 7